MNFTRRTMLQLAAMLTGVAMVPATAYAANYTIAGIVFQQDQYFRGVHIGMDGASKAASAELLSGNSDGKLEKETQLIDTQLPSSLWRSVAWPLKQRSP